MLSGYKDRQPFLLDSIGYFIVGSHINQVAKLFTGAA